MKNTTAIGVYKLTLLGHASHQVRTVNGLSQYAEFYSG